MDIKIIVLSMVVLGCHYGNGAVLEPTPKPIFGQTSNSAVEGKEGDSGEDYGIYDNELNDENPTPAPIPAKKANPFAFLDPEELLKNPDFQAYLASRGKTIGPSAPKPTPERVLAQAPVFNPLLAANGIETIDFCPKRPDMGLKYYCMNLNDGLYFDPWNPFCGYVQCTGGVASRMVCPRGTWMGMMSSLYLNTKDMCRKSLTIYIGGEGECPASTDFTGLCRNAERKDGIHTIPKIESSTTSAGVTSA